MSITFSAATIAGMAFELALGMSFKLYVENGRISWDDLKNGYLSWIPGVKAQEGDGLSRAVDAMVAEMDFPGAPPLGIAAK